MDGQVDRASGERLLELLYKEALAAHVRERPRGHLVAAGADFDDFNFGCRDLRRQPRAHDRGLRERQFAWAGTDFDFERHSDNLTPNPFPSGKGNRKVWSDPFPRGKGTGIQKGISAAVQDDHSRSASSSSWSGSSGSSSCA